MRGTGFGGGTSGIGGDFGHRVLFGAGGLLAFSLSGEFGGCGMFRLGLGRSLGFGLGGAFGLGLDGALPFGFSLGCALALGLNGAFGFCMFGFGLGCALPFGFRALALRLGCTLPLDADGPLALGFCGSFVLGLCGVLPLGLTGQLWLRWRGTVGREGTVSLDHAIALGASARL